MRNRKLITLLISALFCVSLLGCGKEKEGTTVVSTDSATPIENVAESTDYNETTEISETKDVVKKLYIEEDTMYLPDGRVGELRANAVGKKIIRNIEDFTPDALSICKVDNLYPKFNNIDFEVESDGETYYFKCDIEKDGQHLTYNNIDTNMDSWEISYGFCYGVPNNVTNLGVTGTDDCLIIGNLSWVYLDKDGNIVEGAKPATLNGVELDYVNYLKSFKEDINHDSIWVAEMYEGEEQAKVTDIWLDSDDPEFGVSFEGMEADEFLNWRGVDPGNIQIGYIAKQYGLSK